MIYEIRTYSFTSGSVKWFEAGFAEAIPYRLKYSKLGAFWKTAIGPLNEALHIWLYDDLKHREQARAEALNDPNWDGPRAPSSMYVWNDTEVFHPAPFMRPWGETQELGNIYEMRMYTYKPGTIPEVLKRWGEAIPYREKYSPLAAAWYTNVGGLNKFIHVWPYANLAEREKVRAEANKDPHWPAPTREFLVRQENKILTPAPFSPMR